MPQPGTKLTLTQESTGKLSNLVLGLIEDLEAEHRPRHDRIKTFWKWYEATPASENRDFPWPNASNIVVPLIRTWADNISNRHFQQIHSAKDMWIADTQNETIKPYLPPWMQYLNWSARGNVFDTFIPTWDWISEMVPVGSSVLALNWVHKTSTRYVPGSKKPRTVTVSRGPVLEHIPLDQIMWVPGTNISESDVVVRQRWMTRAELVRHGAMADWDDEALASALAEPDGEFTSSRREANEQAGFAGTQSIPLWDIRECWVAHPMIKAGRVPSFEEMDKDSPPVPIVVTIHPGSHKILRVISHPYFFPHFPFYDIHFRKRPGRNDSDGVALMARHLQEGASTLMNQSVDAITLANSVNFVTTESRMLGYKFVPNQPVLVDSMDSIRELNLSKQVTPDLALLNMIISTGERLFSVSDPALGRETRMGGRPSPATSTVLMLQQLQLNLGSGLGFIRKQLSKIGEDISTLYQQFETDEDGRIEKALGATDAGIVKEIILPLDEPLSGNVRFDLHALSEVFNPDQEMQKAVVADQFLTNYYSKLLQALQILNSEMGQVPDIREVVIQSMRGLTLSARRFLEANDFDPIEDVLPKMEGNFGDQQQQLLTSADQLLQRMGGGGAGSAQLAGMGRGAGGPNGPMRGPVETLGSGL